MRPFFVPAMAFASLLLAGCASAPNDPTLTLQTSKTPAQYADCVVPKLQGSALNPTVSQTQRSYRIVSPVLRLISRYGNPRSMSFAACQRCAIASSSAIVHRSRKKRSASSRLRNARIVSKRSLISVLAQLCDCSFAISLQSADVRRPRALAAVV